jgi:hypothetical protein
MLFKAAEGDLLTLHFAHERKKVLAVGNVLVEHLQPPQRMP